MVSQRCRMVRGPLLVIVAVSSLLLPFLLKASPQTLVSIVALLLGLSLAAFDAFMSFGEQIESLQIYLQTLMKTIVLDDLFRDIFSVKDGFAGTVFETLIGSAGLYSMYNLPLSTEQRIRLMQSCLPQGTNAAEILMSPGGVFSIIPQNFRRTSTTESVSLNEELCEDKDIDFQENLNLVQAQEPSPAAEHSKMCHAIVPDLTWDGQDSNFELNDGDETDGPLTYEEVSLGAQVVNRSQSPIQSAQSEKGGASNMRGRYSSQVSSLEIDPNNDPFDVSISIAQEVFSEYLRRVSQKLDGRVIKTVGISSFLALMLQLKSSRTSRKLLYGAIQGSLTLGLANVTFASIYALKVKKHMESIYEDDLSSVHAHDPLRIESSRTCQRFTSIQDSVRMILGRVKNDSYFKRWRNLLAVVVLFYFSTRRQHNKMRSLHY